MPKAKRQWTDGRRTRLNIRRLLYLLSGMTAIAPAWAVAEEPTGFPHRLRIWNAAPSNRRRPNLPQPLSSRPRTRDSSRGPSMAGHEPDLRFARARSDASSTQGLSGGSARQLRRVHDAESPEGRAHEDRVLVRPPLNQWEKGRSNKWQWPSGTEATLTILCQGHGWVPHREGQGARAARRRKAPPPRALAA